jgi:hypothetical protein
LDVFGRVCRKLFCASADGFPLEMTSTAAAGQSAADAVIEQLRQWFGIGMAFQIVDDILDFAGSRQRWKTDRFRSAQWLSPSAIACRSAPDDLMSAPAEALGQS